MSRLRQIGLIAWRDFLQRARSRAFLVSMFIIVALVLGVGPLVAQETRTPEPYQIGVVGAVDPQLAAALTTAAAVFDRGVEVVPFDNGAEAEAALDADDVDVVIEAGSVVWKSEPRLQLGAIVTAAFQTLHRNQAIADLGLSPDEAARLLAPPPPPSRSLHEPEPADVPKQIASYVGSILLYISILMFGQFVMMGVMEEKQSRVVEVVLSRTRPTMLLAGKVVGIGALGVVQLVVIGVAALLMANMVEIVDVDLAGLGVRVVLTVLFWYLLGYTLFAVMYAALGATISRQEDAQGVAMLPILLIVPGFFISIAALEDPNGALAYFGSLVPPFSAFVMPTRMTVTDVPAWEVGLSIVLIVAMIYAILRLGARIYQGSILRFGAKVRLRDAWKAGGE